MKVRGRLRTGQTTVVAVPSAAPIFLGGIECDRAKRRVLRDGRELRLTPTEFDLLAYLMRNVGKTFTRGHLLAALWGAEHVDLRTVDAAIGRLRRALNRSFYPDPIRSVRGRGYKFREDFEETHLRWVARGRKKRQLRPEI
jgi:DNA-binding response OmpR family regulator